MSEDTQKAVLQGKPPGQKPPRVEDFDELDKKSIDALVDYMKYVATASGITMGFFARTVNEDIASVSDNIGKLIVFSPILFWMLAILFSVIGVFPRTYSAKTDYEKESVVNEIREKKSKFTKFSVLSFLAGFLCFVYIIAARLWRVFPFPV